MHTSHPAYAVRVRLLTLVTAALGTMQGCTQKAGPDAYGNFEATEVVVSAQAAGQLLQFTPVEGMRLTRGTMVALVDTGPLVLERQQAVAQRTAVGSRTHEMASQIQVLAVQRDIAQRVLDRTKRLYSAQAATAQQLDQAERDYGTLVAQIEAVRAQQQTVGNDVATTNARVAQIRDRIVRNSVVNPESGTVLATYVHAGESVQSGQPLYRIANLDTLTLRVYFTGSQLAAVRLGQSLEVHVDSADGRLATLPGTVIWISAVAEFTPTPVQTRDERANLVYAAKIRVANSSGALRIGMPADITLASPPGR